MAKVIVVADQKGGVGKSTTANFISYELATLKKSNKVLLIDFDPQASQTNAFLGLEDYIFAKDNHKSDISKIFRMENPEPILIKDVNEEYTIDFIPANEKLVDFAEDTTHSYDSKIDALRNYIDRIQTQYTHIVIDTQPLFGVLTKSAIIVADTLFVPVATRAVDENGIKRFFEKTSEVLNKYNQNISEIFVLPTMHQKVVTDSRGVLENVQLLPRYISTLNKLSDSKVTMLDEFPQRTVVSKASGRGLFLVDMINNWGPYDKDTKDLVKQIRKIAKLIA